MALFHAGKDYDNFFDARSYVRSRFSSPNGVVSNEEYQAFNLRCYHDFYQKYRFNSETTRVLEFGGGPCISPLISAAPHAKEIVFAEYVKGCREEVQLWKDCSPEAHDWKPYFRYYQSYTVCMYYHDSEKKLIKNLPSQGIDTDIDTATIFAHKITRRVVLASL